MKKHTLQFATVNKNGVVQTIGKSAIYQPKIQYNNKKTKFFDDSKLIKKNHS